MNEQRKSRNPAEYEPAWVQMSCGCCPPSERWWFRWVMLSQPVLAAAIIAFNHFAGN